ncbi:HPP family protein [Roseateles asaccharophilus]|uniref:CBS domain-containing membrane protein n=1 Tax=Roseateles asaccharophilus TaxID=582607 RepID=A0ABU2AEN0_9BURK|nr:HPP family protein [Roseateles asaccharophilus]MDR7335663.1 CBS domain-containing membrane protein [Roseateles asaccharophilus]
MSSASLPDRVLSLLNALRPAPLAVDARERLRVVLGAGLGVLLAGLLTHLFDGANLPWLVAPLGASAVLVFGVPASPLAQPWAVVGGNTVSALVGIACLHWLPLPPVGIAATAVALAIALMFALRCLHPPGGAAALLMVLTGMLDWHFAFVPVALNSLLLVLAGMAYNSATGRRYPHAQHVSAASPAVGASVAPPRFGDAELDAVLARYNQVLDVPRDDLSGLLQEAELLAYRNRLGGLRCADIMSSPVVTVEFGTPLAEAWALLQQHRIKALPVVDRVDRIVGIVTRADFIRAAEGEQREGLAGRLQTLLKPSPQTHSTKPEAVGQIMTRQVRVASADRAIAELVPLFSAIGHHHLPIVGEQARLVGILTQSDLVKALSHGP